jgi:hypothetical protein
MKMHLAVSRLALASSVGLLVLAGVAGCDRQEAKQAGNNTEHAADRAGDAISSGLHQAGSVANEGIRESSREIRADAPGVRSATTQAAHDLRIGAERASQAAARAGDRIHDSLAPATQPAQ